MVKTCKSDAIFLSSYDLHKQEKQTEHFVSSGKPQESGWVNHLRKNSWSQAGLHQLVAQLIPLHASDWQISHRANYQSCRPFLLPLQAASKAPSFPAPFALFSTCCGIYCLTPCISMQPCGIARNKTIWYINANEKHIFLTIFLPERNNVIYAIIYVSHFSLSLHQTINVLPHNPLNPW